MKIYLIQICIIWKMYCFLTLFTTTRQLALLDPIILNEDMSPLNQGVIRVHKWSLCDLFILAIWVSSALIFHSKCLDV